MMPGGAQQEHEARQHHQRRRGDDGIDPVPQGVGQVRRPVGQGVSVIHIELGGQHNLYCIGIFNRARARLIGISPVIVKSKLPPKSLCIQIAAAPKLFTGLVLDFYQSDIPLQAVSPCRFPLYLIRLGVVIPLQIIEKRPSVSPGDIGKQFLLEGRLAGAIDICLIQKRRPKNAAGCHGGHHHQQQKGHDLGYGALRQLCLASGSLRGRRGDLLRHRLGDLLFDMRFHGFHVRIPFSSLYPWPQTTFKYRGSAGLISSFSRRWRMWTATVFSLPKGASFHTFR